MKTTNLESPDHLLTVAGVDPLSYVPPPRPITAAAYAKSPTIAVWRGASFSVWGLNRVELWLIADQWRDVSRAQEDDELLTEHQIYLEWTEGIEQLSGNRGPIGYGGCDEYELSTPGGRDQVRLRWPSIFAETLSSDLCEDSDKLIPLAREWLAGHGYLTEELEDHQE